MMGTLGEDVLNFGEGAARREFALIQNIMLAVAVFFGAAAFDAADVQVMVAYIAALPPALVLWRNAVADASLVAFSRWATLSVGAACGALVTVLGA